MLYLPRVLGLALAVTMMIGLQSCGGGGSATSSTVPQPIIDLPAANSPPLTVQITGFAKFESVTHGAGVAALDYANITTKPMRGMLVAAVSDTTVVGSATTSDTGAFTLNVPANSNVSLAVSALMLKTSGSATWNIGVYDNTDGGALWQIQGPAASVGAVSSTRNITAPLGWNGSAYTAAQRASGPFAILDTMYDGIRLVTSVTPQTQFPELKVFWSPKNTTVSGNRTLGEIGNSFFTEQRQTNSPIQRAIFLLGKEDVDTDEFDSGVIAHEFGHYLQSSFSQSHSTGGIHATGDLLDMTLSYGEGWGYAYASLVRNSPNNPDSSGLAQSRGGIIRTGTDPNSNPRASVGWFSESSVQYIIYSLGLDKGFAPIWTAFTGPMRSGQDALNTIFSFAAGVRSTASVGVVDSLNALLTGQRIFAGAGADQWGTGEANFGNDADSLPVHRILTVGAAPVPLCFSQINSDNPNPNKLGEQRYLRFNNPTAGSRTITVSSNAIDNHDIDFDVYHRGGVIAIAESQSPTSEVLSRSFPAGEILIRAIDFNLATASVSDANKTNCATIRVN